MNGFDEEHSAREHERPYEILMVCYANLCRSPMAEVMLSARLRETFGQRSHDSWRVTSAGIYAAEGYPIHQDSLAVLTELGYFERGESSRQVTEEIIRAADLILTADREQRSFVVRLHPPAVKKTYTLRQFGRLCAAGRSTEPGLVISGGQDLEALAHIGRPRASRAAAEDDEIPDPVGEDVQAFRATAYMISQSIDQMLGSTPKAWGAGSRVGAQRPIDDRRI
ncbi:MAG: hypothetical protein R2735_05860 [Microthrixaceae bacterium]